MSVTIEQCRLIKPIITEQRHTFLIKCRVFAEMIYAQIRHIIVVFTVSWYSLTGGLWYRVGCLFSRLKCHLKFNLSQLNANT